LLSKVFQKFGDLNHNFILDGYFKKNTPKETFFAGEFYSPKTGRLMQVYTSEPCVQVYSGNFMDEFSAFDKRCKKRNGIAFETMRPQNAINIPQFAHEVILRPGETMYQKTVHRFSLEK